MVTVLYARRSKPSQTDARDTVDSQLAELREYAASHGWTDTQELWERGTPASAAADRATRRKVFHGELVPKVERGEVERVLVVEPSRISRHMATFMPFVDQVEVHFTRDNRSTLDSDPLRLALDAGLAAQESKIRSDRQKAHRKRMKESGRSHSGGFRRYGYEPDGVTLRAKEVSLIRRAAEDVLRGRPLRQIAITWNEKGMQNARGKPIASGSIRSMLLSTDLIDEETRQRLRAYLSDPSRRGNAGGFNKRTFLLSGMCVCGECGTGLTSERTYNGSRWYSCKISASDGKLGACKKVRVEAEPLEEQVREQVSAATIWKRKGADGSTLAAQQAKLETARIRVADAVFEGTLDRQQVKRANERIAKEQSDIDAKTRGLPPAGDEKMPPYDAADFPAWRRLIEKRIDRVTVTARGRVKVTFKEYVRPGQPKKLAPRVKPVGK